MAAGGEKGCTLASDLELHRQLRELWKDWLEAQVLGEAGLLNVAPRQPLHLKLLRAMLEATGDPDRGYPWVSWTRYLGRHTSSRSSRSGRYRTPPGRHR